MNSGDRHGDRHGHGHGHGHEHGHAPKHDHGHSHSDDTAHTHRHAHSDPKPAQRHVHAVKSRRIPESAVYALEKMAHGFRRLGRAAGGGFYDYSSDPPQLWSGLKTFERRGRKVEPADVRDRLILAGAIAAIGASAGTTPGSVPAVFGGQIPGDAAQARALLAAAGGEAAFAARASDLATRFGPRFQAPASIPGPS